MKIKKNGALAPEAPQPKPVTYPVPEIALTAMRLVEQQFQQSANQLAGQTVRSLGLDPEEYAYDVNFQTGVITRGAKAK